MVSDSLGISSVSAYNFTNAGEYLDRSAWESSPSFEDIEFLDASGCLASFAKSYQDNGFSESATKLIIGAWASSTQKQYHCAISKWRSWCSEQQIDPVHPPISMVGNYLASLFDMNNAYRI